MELKEIIGIFKREKKIFFAILGLFIFTGTCFFLFQQEKMVANLMVNVTRKGAQQTEDYKYDHFYRFQADERFADTVVRWISSPSILSEIEKKSEIQKGLEIKAKRLSSQMIELSFVTNDHKQAEMISNSITEVLNSQTEKLNESQKDEAWFILVSNKVETLNGKIPSGIIFIASIMAGLFFATLGVIIRNYMKD